MLKLYGFKRVPAFVVGLNRDLRVEWLINELELEYEFIGIDFWNGEQGSDAFREISPFGLVPAINDGGLSLSESGAILFYLAEKHKKFLPENESERLHVIQWCFSILNTLEKRLSDLRSESVDDQKMQVGRFLKVIDQKLESGEWIGGKDFSIADILLSSVIRPIRSSNLMKEYEFIDSYLDKSSSRRAWHKTIKNYSDRVGRPVSDFLPDHMGF